MVHQHFMLIPVMTVAENIVLAEEPTRQRRPPRHRRGRAARARDLRPLRPRRRPERADPGHHRRPAAAGRDPEGALPRGGHPRPRRADRRADAAGGEGALRGRPLRSPARGKSIIFITHKLNEVLEIADRITVLRRGKLIETLPGRGRDGGEPRAADGRPRRPPARRQDGRPARRAAAPGRGPPRVRRPRDREGPRRLVRGARGGDRRARRDRRERPDGADRRDDGPAGGRRRARCASTGRTSRRETAHGHFEAGLGHIPEDRQRRGLVLEYSIAENIALHDYRSPPASTARLALPAPAGRARAQADQGLRRARRRPARRARAGSRAATSRRSSSRARSSATRRC